MTDCVRCQGEGCGWCEPIVPRQTFQMARRGQPDTSYISGKAILDSLGKIQRNVVSVFMEHGHLTDLQLHRLCCERFGNKAESTYRKRRSELTEFGIVVDSGERVNHDGATRAIYYLAGAI